MTIYNLDVLALTIVPFVSSFYTGWHGKTSVKTEISGVMFRIAESSSGAFFLQLISSLFHIKEIIVEWEFMLPFFQTNNVFTEAEACGLPSKRLNVCLMCLLFDISLEYI